jgi:hypothetical protein
MKVSTCALALCGFFFSATIVFGCSKSRTPEDWAVFRALVAQGVPPSKIVFDGEEGRQDDCQSGPISQPVQIASCSTARMRMIRHYCPDIHHTHRKDRPDHEYIEHSADEVCDSDINVYYNTSIADNFKTCPYFYRHVREKHSIGVRGDPHINGRLEGHWNRVYSQRNTLLGGVLGIGAAYVGRAQVSQSQSVTINPGQVRMGGGRYGQGPGSTGGGRYGEGP